MEIMDNSGVFAVENICILIFALSVLATAAALGYWALKLRRRCAEAERLTHDLNNFLGAVCGAAQCIRRDAGNREQTEKYADLILEACCRAGETARGCFSARSSENDCADINTCVEKSLERLRLLAPENVRLEAELSASENIVRGSAAALEGALLNLGKNALEALPDGGAIRISTRSIFLDAGAMARFSLKAKPGLYGMITVADDGPGIAPESGSRIFEKNFTTKRAGCGLGLFSVRKTVVSCGGALSFESSGRGTVFTLALPVLEKVKTFPKVLVVDDDEMFLRITADLLKAENIEAVCAGNGREAEEICRADPSVGAALIDFCLPGADGAEVFRTLRRIRPGIRVLFLTGNTADEKIQKITEKDPFCAPASKPCTGKELREKLAFLLAKE